MSLHLNLSALGKVIGMAAGMALAGGLAACNSENVSFGDKKGVPLAELDLSGPAPDGIALMGPDKVTLTEGDRLTIEVEGSDAIKAAMRFALSGGTLGVLRSKSAPEGEIATVHVTMPAPNSIVIAGSGQIDTAGLARTADVTVTGSGTANSPNVNVASLTVNIVGSGTFAGGGRADALKLSIAGSGAAQLSELRADKASVNIAGSGEGTFRSDGTVKANIMGSGKVRVIGRAECEVHAVGSGTLVCEPG